MKPVLFGVFGVLVVLTGILAQSGSRPALFVAALLGIPMNVPWMGRQRQTLIPAKARWLASFLTERPRGFNTPGAHLVYGVIAVKRSLKLLCAREERASRACARLVQERSELVAELRSVTSEVAQCLASDNPQVVNASRRELAITRRLEELESELLAIRLSIQHSVLADFRSAWREVYEAGLTSAENYASVSQQFRSSTQESATHSGASTNRGLNASPRNNLETGALLPDGLIPSRTAYIFEYGMFLGRCVVGYLFISTFNTPYFFLALAILLLNLYVVEPVVQKLYISTFNLVLESPGHKLVDLKQYLDTNIADGSVLRVPLIVPKFSSNPALGNLQACIESTARKCAIKPSRVIPFAIREGNRDTVLQFDESVVSASLSRFASTLVDELAKSRAKFPLNSEVEVQPGRVVIRLTDEDSRIWELVGEDASQAFIYLRRNLFALRDTLSHVGPKLQPVFMFVSNTKDPDVIAYEVEHLAELQRISDEEFGGQVGFLHLLRGGEWYNFNAYLQRFDATDKDFQRAMPEFVRRFAEDDFPAKAYLLSILGEKRSPQDFARAFNAALNDPAFFEEFSGVDFHRVPRELRPPQAVHSLLNRARAGERLSRSERRDLNRELLLTVVPAKIRGDFFKKVGNDIAVHELLVRGKTKPTVYIQRESGEHVQDPSKPNFVRVWGDLARYTGLQGSHEEIRTAILAGEDIPVAEVPQVAAIIDDKNEFGPGELEKGISIFLHPENRHIVIGVPRINVTLPELKGQTIASEYILGARLARDCHNYSDSRSRAAVFSSSSAAYGKWLHRPTEYFAHYAREVLNPAHALSHDFQQSYLVAGAAGCVGGFSEALYGPTRFHAHVEPARKAEARSSERGWRRARASAELLSSPAHSLMSSARQQ